LKSGGLLKPGYQIFGDYATEKLDRFLKK